MMMSIMLFGFHMSTQPLHHLLQTSEKEMIRKELAKDAADIDNASEDVIYKIDIPANRYDMLCLEGIARALNIFTGRIQPPQYRLADMKGELQQLRQRGAASRGLNLGMSSSKAI
jgi:hypothetical protein